MKAWIKAKMLGWLIRAQQYLVETLPSRPLPSSLTCPECGGATAHNEKYDVYFCAECDVYSEERCSDHRCQFCRNRPERPSRMGA